jgi:hypothetical protein
MSEGAAAFSEDELQLTDAEKRCFARTDQLVFDAADQFIEHNVTLLDRVLLYMTDVYTIWQCRTLEDFLNLSTDLALVHVIGPLLRLPELAPLVQAYPHLRSLATVLIRETTKNGHAQHTLDNVGKGRWRRARNVQALTGRLPNAPVSEPIGAAVAATVRRHDLVQALDVFENIQRVRVPAMSHQVASRIRAELVKMQSIAQTLSQLRNEAALPDPSHHIQLLARPEVADMVRRGHNLAGIMRTALFQTLDGGDGDNANVSVPALTETDKELWTQCQQVLGNAVRVHKQLNYIMAVHQLGMTMMAMREMQAIMDAPTLSHYLFAFAHHLVPDAQFGEVESRVHRRVPTQFIEGYPVVRAAIIATIKLMCSVDENVVGSIESGALGFILDELIGEMEPGQSFLAADDPYREAFALGFQYWADMARALDAMSLGRYTPPEANERDAERPELTEVAQRRLEEASVVQLAIGASFHRAWTGRHQQDGGRGKRKASGHRQKSKRKGKGNRKTRRS